jgi:hypothetical protein
MSEMGSYDPFEHLKHKLWPKKRSRVKLLIWLLINKSWESTRLNSIMWRWRATYRCKDLDKGYNFALDLISIGGLHIKLWGPKVTRVPTLGISGQNVIWMWASWRSTEYIIRGKLVTSPKSGLRWVLWVRISPWLILAPKMLKLYTNQLVIGLCKFVWVIKFLPFLPNFIPEL